jgi:6-phosphofructokinase 1
MEPKRVGILTSGGDCSGLNSVIRAAYLRCRELGFELVGIKRGLCGLSKEDPDYVMLDGDTCDCNLMLQNSGSIIYSDTKWVSWSIKSGMPLADLRKLVRSGYRKLALDGLLCVGGDGSLHLINELMVDDPSLKLVAIPKTIDNDVCNTDFSVGFQTAVEVAVRAMEDIMSCAKSHERAMVVEVMGRGAGYIALYSGLAAGADVIIVPEFKFDISKVREKARKCFEVNQKGYCLIVVAESVEVGDFRHEKTDVDGVVKYTRLSYMGIGHYLAGVLNEDGVEARSVTLGHIQRGGRTSVNDRLLGTMFGTEAVNLIANDDCGKMLNHVMNTIRAVEIKKATETPNRTLSEDNEYARIAKQLGVYIGEI